LRERVPLLSLQIVSSEKPSPFQIRIPVAIAREKAEREKIDVRLIEGDMRTIKAGFPLM
jgi:hypothetical protein